MCMHIWQVTCNDVAGLLWSRTQVFQLEFPYKVGLRADSEGVQQEGSQVPESSSIQLLHRRWLPVTQTSSREIGETILGEQFLDQYYLNAA